VCRSGKCQLPLCSQFGPKLCRCSSRNQHQSLLVVDQYFTVADWIGERIEELDERVTDEERGDLIQQLYALKRGIIFLRKTILPLRDVISTLRNIDSDLIREATQPYLRDLHDHVVQLSDRIETGRDLLSGLQDVYLSTLSNRTNTVMKIVGGPRWRTWACNVAVVRARAIGPYGT